jgi:Fe-S-cluster-containing hydrogenase component 2
MENDIKEFSKTCIAGVLTISRLSKTPGFPKEKDFEKGLIAVIECDQDIPCNPCEEFCKKNAIKVGFPITNLPQFQVKSCDGCLECLRICPGLCIFGVNKNYSDDESLIYIPYEFLPLPFKGAGVKCLDRSGKEVCRGKVFKVLKSRKKQYSTIVGILVSKKYFNIVRHFNLSDE